MGSTAGLHPASPRPWAVVLPFRERFSVRNSSEDASWALGPSCRRTSVGAPSRPPAHASPTPWGCRPVVPSVTSCFVGCLRGAHWFLLRMCADLTGLGAEAVTPAVRL